MAEQKIRLISELAEFMLELNNTAEIRLAVTVFG